jgi:hypothetical protein
VVRKPIHVDDGCYDPPILAISCKVWAWVMKYLMPLVGKERGGGRKQTSITVTGGIGVVNVPYGGQGAWERHNLQNNGGGSGIEHRHIGGEVHGKGNSMHRNWEGDVTEGGNDGDPLIADEGEAFFFVYNRAPRERKEARTMPFAATGAASPWFLVRAQKPADSESEPN